MKKLFLIIGLIILLIPSFAISKNIEIECKNNIAEKTNGKLVKDFWNGQDYLFNLNVNLENNYIQYTYYGKEKNGENFYDDKRKESFFNIEAIDEGVIYWTTEQEKGYWIQTHVLDISNQRYVIYYDLSDDFMKEMGSLGWYNNLRWDCFENNSELTSALFDYKIDDSQQINENNNSIVAASSGTGFFITDAGHIITNNHVIDYCDEVKVHYLGNEQQISLVASDLVNDLALLKSEISPENIFAIASEDINLLEEIYIAGFPFGKAISSSIKVTKGVVSSLSGVGDNYSNMQVDAALQPGNSGGPIIDENGNVVGVAVAKLDFATVIEMFDAVPENTNFGIKSSVLNTFIKANNISLAAPSDSEISKSEISQKITNATVYLDCWMSQAKIQELSSKKVMFKYIK